MGHIGACDKSEDDEEVFWWRGPPGEEPPKGRSLRTIPWFKTIAERQ